MSNTESAPLSVPGADEPQGVGGWLVLLCVGLTILSPILTLFNLIVGIKDSLPLIGRIPRWGLFITIDTTLSLVVTILCFVAGFRMWKEYPLADRWGKAALGATIAYHFLTLALVPAMQFAPQLEEGIGKELLPGVARGVITSSLWLLYLYRSTRVRNTYHVQSTEGTTVVA